MHWSSWRRRSNWFRGNVETGECDTRPPGSHEEARNRISGEIAYEIGYESRKGAYDVLRGHCKGDSVFIDSGAHHDGDAAPDQLQPRFSASCSTSAFRWKRIPATRNMAPAIVAKSGFTAVPLGYRLVGDLQCGVNDGKSLTQFCLSNAQRRVHEERVPAYQRE